MCPLSASAHHSRPLYPLSGHASVYGIPVLRTHEGSLSAPFAAINHTLSCDFTSSALEGLSYLFLTGLQNP